ncbi:restriction endonuclease subunit S [Corynebacterium sp. CNCTC7651]|nr:restriction endonuclease subunit S [Corynebacterium sp. CNCTC7651]
MRNEDTRVPALRLAGFDGPPSVVPIESIAGRTIGGGTPSTSNPSFWQGALPWIQSSDLDEDDPFAVNVCKFISTNAVDSSASSEIPANSLAVVTRVGVGKVALMPEKYATSQDFLNLSELRGDPHYLAYAVKRRVSQAAKSAQGTSIKGMTKPEVLALTITTPCLEEQRAVSSLMRAVESLTNTSKLRAGSLTSLKQTMLVKMFPQGTATAPEVRFEGFEGDWERSTLGQVVESFRYGVNATAVPYDGETKYLRITDIDPGAGDFGTGETTSPGVDRRTADEFLLCDGDIVFARTGATVGRSFLYRKQVGRTVWAGFLIRARVTDAADPDFVYSSTLTPGYWEYVRMTSQRSGQPGLNSTEYANLPIALPSLSEQQAIGAYFRNLDALIDAEQKKLATLRNLKSALLTQMFV